jgi:hypothetical protein
VEVKIKYIKEDELNEIKQELGFERFDERIGLKEVKTILTKFNALHLENEICKEGVASDFCAELNGPKQSIPLDEFIRWVFTETRGHSIIEKLESMFTNVEVIEHFSNSYLIKVSRDNYSIGYLFGMMEDIKTSYSISEYSVSQTTLEQIFNNFAKEADSGVSIASYNML